jgi:cytochrome o ubiquinol oxidase subunit IV
MSDTGARLHLHDGSDHAPGDEPASGHEIAEGLLGYIVGLFLAALITAVAFFLVGTSLVWRPSIPVALLVLAVAQMGVHLVFFLHITTGPDNTNNVLALAFGVLIVTVVVAGSLWIMTNLNDGMMPPETMNLHMQR